MVVSADATDGAVAEGAEHADEDEDDGVEPPALFARTAEESAERGLPLRPLNPDYWWEHPDYRPVYHGNEDYRAPDPPPRRAVFGDGDGAEDAGIARE